MSFSGTKGYLTKPKPGVMLNPLHPLSKGLVGYWLFNEGAGSLANDISGHGNHCALKNMLPNVYGSGWGGSEFGGGLYFDGGEDHVIRDSKSFDDTQGTVEAWIKLSSLGITQYVVSSADETGTDKVCAPLRIDASNVLSVFQRNEIGGGDKVLGDTILSSNTLYHIACVSTGTEYKLCINGEEEGLTISSGSNSGDWFANTSSRDNFVIGALKRTTISNFIHGSIILVRNYNRALAIVEVKQLYKDPFCNLMQVPIRRYSVAAPPIGAIMNQFQGVNLGADLYNGAIIA